MKAFEFQTTLTPNQTLDLPNEVKAQIVPGSTVRVILLLPGANEESAWAHLTVEQFFKGYAESDSIYDKF